MNNAIDYDYMDLDNIISESEYLDLLQQNVYMLQEAFNNLNEFFNTFYCDEEGELYPVGDYVDKYYPFEKNFSIVNEAINKWANNIESIELEMSDSENKELNI